MKCLLLPIFDAIALPNYLPPLQKRTAADALFPLSLTSSTQLVKIFASCFTEQKLKAIAARDNAETMLVPNWITP